MDPRTAEDYGRDVTEPSLSALAELWTILGTYRDALVLVGGWAPYFLLERHQRPDNDFEHVGSIDIDVAVNPALIDERTYDTIVELIGKRGYQPRKDKNGDVIEFSFEKTFEWNGKPFTVQVDFITAPDPDREGRRHRDVQLDLRARMARGCEVVFDHCFEHEVTATLPAGGETTVRVLVADVVGILTTKGMALGDRYKEKDAYDIYAVVANYEEGPADAADEVKPAVGTEVVDEAMGRIEEGFGARSSRGPYWVADFLGASNERERERVITDAHMVVREFLDRLGD